MESKKHNKKNDKTKARSKKSSALSQLNSINEVSINKSQSLSEYEATIVQEKEKQGVILSIINDGVITIDSDLKILMINHAAEMLTGCSIDEAFGKQVEEIFNIKHEQTNKPLILPYEKVFHEGLSFQNNDHVKLISKTGNTRIISYNLSPFHAKDKEIVGFVLVFCDVTQQRIAEAELRESEEAYRTLFESADEAILIVDDKNFITCNDKAMQIFKCGKESFIGKTPVDFSPEFQPDGQSSREIILEKISLALKGNSQHFDWVHKRADGTLFNAEVWLNLIIVQGNQFLQSIIRDITERKSIENELRSSEEQFRTTFENAPIGICLVGIDGNFIAVNRYMSHMLGYEKKEMQGIPFIEITHPDDRAKSSLWVQQMISGEDAPINLEKRYLHKNGKVIWANVSTSLIKDTNGSPIYFITQILDITEKKLEEKARRLNESRLEALYALNNMSDSPIVEITEFALEEGVKLTGSKLGYLAFTNDDESILTMHAWSKEAMHECNISNVTFDYIVNETGLWGEAVRQRKTIITNNYEAENPLKKGYPEGHVGITRHMNVPIFDEEKIVALAGVGNKETDYDALDEKQLSLLMYGMWRLIQRKRHQEAIIESEERYRLIADNSNDIITKFDQTGVVTFISPACKTLLGFDTSEIIGKSIFDFIHPDDFPSLIKYQIEYLRTKEAKLVEHRLKKKDGDYIWVETNNQAVYDENNNISKVVSICRDITEKLRSEKLTQEKEAALMASKAKSEFLANMSHEIRNPLNSVVGLTNTLLRSELNNDLREIVESLKISAGNLLNIVNDILDFSKIEANKMDVQNVNFDVEQVIRHSHASLKTLADQKSLDFTYSFDKNIPPQLYGDSVKFKQIIINLASNAIKFTEKGSVKINATKSKIANDLVFVLVEVIDTGIGIKKEDFGRLFETFTQLDSSTSKSYSGTGIGLAIVKSYTELMKGTVSVTSKYNKESRFSIEIPFELPKEKVKEADGLYRNVDLSNQNLKVLVAEDDGINQLYLKNFLSNQGIKVDTAFNGLQVVEKFESNKYDLILMDGQMPKMDGFEATRIIRKKELKRNTHIPIIAITGYAVIGDKERCLEVGMDDYITKPIDESALMSKIRKYSKK